MIISRIRIGKYQRNSGSTEVVSKGNSVPRHRLGFDYNKDQIGLFRSQCKNIKLRALVMVLVKCYDIKMVLLPLYSFITSLIKPVANNQQQQQKNLIKAKTRHSKTITAIILCEGIEKMFKLQWHNNFICKITRNMPKAIPADLMKGLTSISYLQHEA